MFKRAVTGHGVPAELIKKRYVQSLNNLEDIASHVDNVFIYDNSDRFVNIYNRLDGVVLLNDLKNYPWVLPIL